MNEHDNKNLQFLLDTPLEEIQEWFQTIPLDDLTYATELLKEHRIRLTMEILKLQDEVDDTSEADEVVKNIMLKSRS